MNRSKQLKHCKFVEDFTLNNFPVNLENCESIHKFNFISVLLSDILFKRKKNWRCKLIKQNKEDNIKSHLIKKKGKVDGRLEEIRLDGYLILQTPKLLSLSSDEFILVEHIEKQPLLLTNAGMCSRISRYLYPERVCKAILHETGINRELGRDCVKEFWDRVNLKLGHYGSIINMKEGQKLPIQCQISNPDLVGLTLLENNMYRSPVFPQNLRHRDYLIVIKI